MKNENSTKVRTRRINFMETHLVRKFSARSDLHIYNLLIARELPFRAVIFNYKCSNLIEQKITGGTGKFK